LRPGQQLSAAEVRSHVAEYLVSFKVPQRVNFIDRMPRDHVGRVNRAALATQAEVNTVLAKRENVERRIAGIWASELNLPFVGPDENFFEIGGDSLAGVRILLAIESEFNHRLSPHVWASISTVNEMASVLRRDLATNIPKPEVAAKSPSIPDELFRIIGMVMSSGAIKTMPDDPTIKVINPGGKRVPLVWVFNSPDREMTGLSKYWSSDRPLFGLYSGSRQIPKTEDTRKRIAAYYCDRLLDLFPDGNFYLAGNCRGGTIAHRILKGLNDCGIFPKRVMFLEYIDQSLFDYPGEVRFVFGKQSHLRFSFGPAITAVLRIEKATNVRKLFWIDGEHGQFFYGQIGAALAREVMSFIGEYETANSAG
jgi:acyl carrier protein